MKKIDTIVFDLGGVILDLDRDCAVSRFKDMGVLDIEDMLDPYEQKGLFLNFENGGMDMEEFCENLSKHVGRKFSKEEIDYGWLGFIMDTPQYKLDYIKELRKDYKVYILSNTNPSVMEWASTPDFSEEGLPLTAYCDKIFASYQMKTTKPNPLIFELMIKDTGLVPEQTLFVDDGTRNVEMGEKLGFKTYQPKNKEDWRETLNELLGR